MKYYIVKEVSVATENNPSFSGMEEITYSGKKEMVLGRYGSMAEALGTQRDISRFLTIEYGYKRRSRRGKVVEI